MTHSFKRPALSLFLALGCALGAFLGAGSSAHANADSVAPAEEPSVVNTFIRDAMKSALAKRRAAQIERLEAYLADGLFPRNRVSDEVVNVFRDADGLLCAIAFLIHNDGHIALVEDTATKNNLVRIGELKSGQLVDWVIGSGFTQAEVAMVQLPDSPVLTGGGREWFIAENQRIRLHLAAAIQQLKLDSDKSLDMATDQLLARFAADARRLARI